MEDGSLHRFRRYVRPRNAGTACGRIQALRRSPQRLPRHARSGKPPDRRSRRRHTRPGRRFPCPKRAPALSCSPNRHPCGRPARSQGPRSRRDPGPSAELIQAVGPSDWFRPRSRTPIPRPRIGTEQGPHASRAPRCMDSTRSERFDSDGLPTPSRTRTGAPFAAASSR